MKKLSLIKCTVPIQWYMMMTLVALRDSGRTHLQLIDGKIISVKKAIADRIRNHDYKTSRHRTEW